MFPVPQPQQPANTRADMWENKASVKNTLQPTQTQGSAPAEATQKAPSWTQAGAGGNSGGHSQQQLPIPRLSPSNQHGAPPAVAPLSHTPKTGTWQAPVPNKLQARQAPAPLRHVNPEETVHYQLQGILNQDSDYMRHARLRGMQYANDRGLLSSSIGAGAAQQAALEAALPIAQQDAETFSQAALANQKARLDTGLANLDANTQTGLANLDAETRVILGNLDANTQREIEIIGGQYRVLLATNEYAKDLVSRVTQNIAAVQESSHSGEFKAHVTKVQTWFLKNGLDQLAGIAKSNPQDFHNLDISQYFEKGHPYQHVETGYDKGRKGTGRNDWDREPPPVRY